MFNSALEIVIKARDEASQSVAGITNKLKELEPRFKQMAVAGTAAFGAISAIGVTALKAYSDAQAQTVVTNKSLENSLNSVSGDALKTLQTQLGGTKDMLGALQKSAEAAGSAAVKMGFDDETASRSFAKLFGVTKDVAGANKELTLAMDLARYKGISLEEATQKLLMVHSGATKELKALGLAVTDGASAMENLDSITKQVTGTASTFSQTTAGQMEVAKVSIDNLKESIGKALEPALQSLITTVQPLLEQFIAWAEANPELIKNILLIGGAVAALVAVVGTLGLVLPSIIAGFTLLSGPVGAVLGVITLLSITVMKVVQIMTLLRDHSKEVWSGLKIMFKETIDAIVAYFQPLINVINNIINALSRVGSGLSSIASTVGGKISSAVSSVAGAISGKKAQGGNISGGSTYLVGENGPELFSASSGGFITPSNKLGGGGGGIVVNINGGNYLSEDAAGQMGDYIIKQLQLQMRGS